MCQNRRKRSEENDHKLVVNDENDCNVKEYMASKTWVQSTSALVLLMSTLTVKRSCTVVESQ